MNFVFACYKESYCVLEHNICLYHCELLLELLLLFIIIILDTSSGQIYCTLDILDIVHSYNRE